MAMPSFAISTDIDSANDAKSESGRSGGREKHTEAYAGGIPDVHASDASRWQASHAESTGPIAGTSDSGSVVTTMTRPAPALMIAASRPMPGPSTTSSRRAPRRVAIRRSNSACVSFPRDGVATTHSLASEPAPTETRLPNYGEPLDAAHALLLEAEPVHATRHGSPLTVAARPVHGMAACGECAPMKLDDRASGDVEERQAGSTGPRHREGHVRAVGAGVGSGQQLELVDHRRGIDVRDVLHGAEHPLVGVELDADRSVAHVERDHLERQRGGNDT